MKIQTVRIQNFRSFEDETIAFNDYNCLVGPNGAGKSTVLNALNVFFRESKSSSIGVLELVEEDFHCRDTSLPVRITVTFGDLSDKAKTDLKDYVRQDQLVVMAVAEWSQEKQVASVLQKGMRLGMKEFAPFFKAVGDSKPVSELKPLYIALRTEFGNLPAPGTKAAMIDALQAEETAHPEKCVLMESDDEFYGITKGAHKLGPFIQWVFVSAVKDATDEQSEAKNTALGSLIERAVRSKVHFAEKIEELRDKTTKEYDTILDANQSALDGLSASLKGRLSAWAHPNIELAVRWDKDPKNAVRVAEPFAKILAGECGFLGELGRLGHGFQRSYILALLEELAASDAADAPRLLLGLEEPELYQHPPQAQHLAEVLQTLSAANAQIFACTHSPYFVVGKGFEDVRLVRKPSKTSTAKVSQTTFAALGNYLATELGESKYKNAVGVQTRLHQVLQPALKEMFFAPTLVLVEGLEDVAYITSALFLSGRWEQWRKCGAHIVQVQGKSELVQPLAIAQLMKIPTFLIFDADGNATKPEHKTLHQKDNERLFKLLKQPAHAVFPAAISWHENFTVWPTNFGDAVAADFIQADLDKWRSDATTELGQPGSLEKNAMFIGSVLEKAWAAQKPSSTLIKLCDSILKFANTANQ